MSWSSIAVMDGPQKLSYTGGSYTNGHFSQVYPGQAMVGANTLMPMYPLYHFHQSQAVGLPAAHIFPPNAAGPLTAVPAIMSKPPSIAPPNAGTYTFIHVSCTRWFYSPVVFASHGNVINLVNVNKRIIASRAYGLSGAPLQLAC